MANSQEPFVITIPIYDGVDLMDVAAPREVFSWMHPSGFDREVEIYCVAGKRSVITRDQFRICRDKPFRNARVRNPDLIWVPGGDPDALARMLKRPDSIFFRYIRQAATQAKWIASVCEGAILLASTGLLDGHDATTHWAFYPCMAAFPGVNMIEPTVTTNTDGQEVYDFPRYIKSGNRVTGGGISSGLDEALFLVDQIAGTTVAEKTQATLQYFPQPPVHGTIVPNDSCPVPGLI